jgi:hypothetical protein
MQYADIIQDSVEKLCTRIEEFRSSESPIDLRVAFAALTVDVISTYSYGESYGILSVPDMEPGLYKNISTGGEAALLLKQYPWILKIASFIPPSILAYLEPNVLLMINRTKVKYSPANWSIFLAPISSSRC